MQAEHCLKAGHDFSFTTGNYHITTTPAREWKIVVERAECPPSDLSYGRVLRDVDECMKDDLVKQASIVREEVIAVVMYTGPMVKSATIYLYCVHCANY